MADRPKFEDVQRMFGMGGEFMQLDGYTFTFPRPPNDKKVIKYDYKLKILEFFYTKHSSGKKHIILLTLDCYITVFIK